MDQRVRTSDNAARQVPKEIKVTENLTAVPVTKNENPYEKELIRLLYSGKDDIVEYILEKVGVENFSNPRYKDLVSIVTEGFNEHKVSPAYLIEKIENTELREFVFKLTLTDETISKKWDEFSYNGKIEKDTFAHVEETIKSFLIHELEAQIKLNNRMISESKDERLHLELLTRNKELQEEKKTLLNSKTS